MVGKKTIRALCQPSRATAPTAAAADADDAQQQQAAADPDAAAAAAAAQGDAQQLPQALVPAGPAFPGLLELDLSCSCSAIGGGIELHLEGMQAAMPLLRVLKLSGLGGFYGEQCCAKRGACSLHTYCWCAVVVLACRKQDLEAVWYVLHSAAVPGHVHSF
jgi:hypothetical protein